jgi:stress response protein SCP2
VSLTLEAEVMPDADTGRLSLVASTDPQLADFGDVTPARLRDMVAATRTRLAEFERLADEQEARETLAALIAEHGLSVEEWDVSSLDSRLRDHITAVYDRTVGDGNVIVVPAGQDPIERLAAVRDLIQDMRGAA